MDTPVTDAHRRLAEDIPCSHEVFGNAQSEVARAAKAIVEDDAANRPMSPDNVRHMKLAIAWYREAQFDVRLSKARFYQAGGTDEMLRQSAEENMSNE